MKDRNNSKTRGFTLIELLVVIAIIAILAAILFPVFGRAKENARRSACTSHLKQICTALSMYVDDNKGKFPKPMWASRVIDLEINKNGKGAYIQDCMHTYIKNVQIWLCPSLKPDSKLPDFGTTSENYSKYSWSQNRGNFEGKDTATNYMWIHLVAGTGFIVSGSSSSLITRPTEAALWYELPYWGSPPHYSTPGTALRGRMMGGNVGYWDGHVKFIIHNYQNVWGELSPKGWAAG